MIAYESKHRLKRELTKPCLAKPDVSKPALIWSRAELLLIACYRQTNRELCMSQIY